MITRHYHFQAVVLHRTQLAIPYCLNMSTKTTFNIGTRRSKLAMTQTLAVVAELQALHPDYTFNVIEQDTVGDKIQDRPLADIGDKGLFTQELEDGLLDHSIDFAVHSLKDLLTTLPEGLTLGCVTERLSPADAILIRSDLMAAGINTIDKLKEHADPTMKNIGTSSKRRQAQLSRFYPELKFRDCRGNLETRIRKLEDGECQLAAIVLAWAGLERQGKQYTDLVAHKLTNLYYAVGQGALGIECRAGDEAVLSLLKPLHHEPTALRCTAERALMRTLEGGCHAPIGVITSFHHNNTVLTISARVLSLDGKEIIEDSRSDVVSEAESLGVRLAETLLERGAGELLRPSPGTVEAKSSEVVEVTDITDGAAPTDIPASSTVVTVTAVAPGFPKNAGFGAKHVGSTPSFGAKAVGTASPPKCNYGAIGCRAGGVKHVGGCGAWGPRVGGNTGYGAKHTGGFGAAGHTGFGAKPVGTTVPKPVGTTGGFGAGPTGGSGAKPTASAQAVKPTASVNSSVQPTVNHSAKSDINITINVDPTVSTCITINIKPT